MKLIYGVASVYGSEFDSRSPQYRKWFDMIRRCYDPNYLNRKPNYRDCFVDDNFLNLQFFGEWYNENYYEIEGEKMSLDKDILVKGNKIYSPTTAIFVPESINSLFTNRQNHRGELPMGVVNHPTGRFKAQCNDGKGKMVAIGLYDTPVEAWLEYKYFKENLIKHKADEYKKYIPNVLYEALYNWSIEITD